MEIKKSVVDNNPNLILEQKIKKLGKFSRITGYLYLILTIIPIIVISLTGFFLNTKTTNYSTYTERENITVDMGYNNAIQDSLEPFIPVFIFIYIVFVILNIFLIYISNKIIKDDSNQIKKHLNILLIISVLIAATCLPSVLLYLGILAIPPIKIIFDIFRIKKIIKAHTFL